MDRGLWTVDCGIGNRERGTGGGVLIVVCRLPSSLFELRRDKLEYYPPQSIVHRLYRIQIMLGDIHRYCVWDEIADIHAFGNPVSYV